MTQRLAAAAAAHPWRTIALWIATIVAAFAAMGALLELESEQRLTNEPESYRAERLVVETFPQRPDVDDVIVLRSERFTVDDERFQSFLRERTAELAGAVALAGEPRPSADRHALLVPLVLREPPDERIDDVIATVRRADDHPDFTAAVTGEWTVDRDFNQLAQNDLKEGEAFFGGPASFVVLVLVFGALVAAGLPLALAVVSILVTLGLSALVTQAWTLSVFVINIVAAVGLALGVDYSLFVLSRYREERHRGADKIAAIVAAGGTASRAVLFSGSAFVIALTGMLLVPDNIMRSLATGAILAGIVSVAAALTLLPAVLSLLGDRVNAVRIPLLGRGAFDPDREGRFWGGVAAAVMRRPVISLALSAALLLALSVPVLDLKTGFASVSTFPQSYESKRGLDALERDFRGGEAVPVQIVVRGDAPEAVERLRARLREDGAFGPSRVERGNGVTVVSTVLRGAATDPLPVSKVRLLRSKYIPDAFEGTDAEVLVGGETARDVDYFDTMERWLPFVIAFVLGLSFILLTIAFRSIVVAAKAILLNLLSVGAAYGLLVLVFQKGWGAELLGFTQVDSIVAWVPLFLFSILFGLSMDYHVFLLSRIRERFRATGDNDEAVAHGIATTSRLITGAAVIIIVVFVGFSTGDLVMFQQMGFGVAVALLLDATIVRSVLLPAAMKLLGERNWYLPRRLEWLPDVRVESH